MMPATGSVAQRIRALSSRRLDFDSYARELSAITGLSEGDLLAQEAGAERLMSLRQRLRLLEAKLRELEGHKRELEGHK